MRINKILWTYFIFLFTWLMSFSAFSMPQNDPVALLQSIANKMILELKANQATLKTKPQIVYRLAHQYVVPYADLAEMSKRVVPPQTWKNASAAQRAEFQRQFTNLLIRTYASALTSYQDQTIQFYPIRGGASGRSVEVNSQIIGGGNQPIRVSYRLLRSGGGWKLYDMSVEGVDMLESFRAQFSDILSRSTMQQLLQQLSAHNTRR